LENKSWAEFSLMVDGELAEVVAEVLARYAPDGVAIESTAVAASPDDSEGHAVGPLRVCAYLPVDSQLDETRRRIEEALWYLGRIRPLPALQARTIQEADWSEAWKEHYRPIRVGERLIILPAWLKSPDTGRIAIRMDPGMAFGTGTHPTTQLCLELLETCLAAIRTRMAAGEALTAIDVGCGSGILSVAALKLGASHALGVDIDPLALTASVDNAALNGVSERLEVGLGSVAEIQAGSFSLRQAPLVLANILAPVIVQLVDGGLADTLSAGGTMILSGILAEQEGEVAEALSNKGLSIAARRQSGDWVALVASAGAG
jgi:ribosomal protein L11 methyltransferase